MPLRKPAPQLAQSRPSSAQPSKPLAMKPLAMRPSAAKPSVVKPSMMKPSAGKMVQKVRPKFAIGKKQPTRRQEPAPRPAAPAKGPTPNSYTAEQVRDYFTSVLSKDIRPKAGYIASALEKLRDSDLTARGEAAAKGVSLSAKVEDMPPP